MNLVLPYEEAAVVAEETNTVGLRQVLEKDILPWLIGAGSVLILYLLIVLGIASTAPAGRSGFELASASLYTQLGVAPIFILAATFIARRKKDTYMWVTALALVLLVMPQRWPSYAMVMLPNTIFSSILALVGILAATKLVGYAYSKKKLGEIEPSLTAPALIAYILIAVISGIMTIPLIYTLTGA